MMTAIRDSQSVVFNSRGLALLASLLLLFIGGGMTVRALARKY